MDDHRGLVIRNSAHWLCLDPDKVQVFPNFLYKLVKVQHVLSADWNVVRELVKQVQLLNREVSICFLPFKSTYPPHYVWQITKSITYNRTCL